MVNFIAGISGKLWGYIAGVGGLIVAYLAIFYKGKSAAHKEIKEETIETVIETHEKVRKNEKEIRDIGDDDVKRNSLLEKYYRD